MRDDQRPWAKRCDKDGNELAGYWDQESQEISKLLAQFAKEGLKITD